VTVRPPVLAPPPPRIRFCAAVTGHRLGHPVYRANEAAVTDALTDVMDQMVRVLELGTGLAGEPLAPTRFHSLLVDGADQVAARLALARDWELVAPLPFGRRLNTAINAAPETLADARALLAGEPPLSPEVRARAEAIEALVDRASLFELADRDAAMAEGFLASLASPGDARRVDGYNADRSDRAALASRIMIEQSDVLIAVWDGVRTNMAGGAGHAVAMALSMGAPVVWIDVARPSAWRILRSPESLADRHASVSDADRRRELARVVMDAIRPADPPAETQPSHAPQTGRAANTGTGAMRGMEALQRARWRPHSASLWHMYRRIEALFGGATGRSGWRPLRQTYDPPDRIGQLGGASVLAAVRAVEAQDGARLADSIETGVLRRFAWADAVSTHLSDAYRSGMILNFLLSVCAIVGGIAYIPFADSNWKWAFALFELVLLSSILMITFLGQARRWHGRWFETRRAAEYLRHAPLLLVLGGARAPGQWPRGADTSWPEMYARQALRDIGLPRVTVQRDYHHAKAQRLSQVHRSLDHLSESMFRLAVLSVAIYLLIAGAGALHWIDKPALKIAANIFTFLGVLLPTLGGAVAGIRYFGDFERFAAISEVTAAKLDSVHARIARLTAAPDTAIDYRQVADLAHAADEIVVAEIENWQAVFGGKHITVPV
jgi:hypothetical protein